MKAHHIKFILLAAYLLIGTVCVYADESWMQFKYDCRHSGNVPDRDVTTPLGLIGAVSLTDAVFTSPVVSEGHVYVVDGSGAAFCIDAKTLRLVWKFETPGGKANCNNVSSPAIVGDYLHFGTMAGSYYVLNKDTGAVVKEIRCGEPIFSTPVVTDNPLDYARGRRVYFSTLGSQVYALEPDGTICWIWDFVKEIMRFTPLETSQAEDKLQKKRFLTGFTGNRWSGQDWLKHKGARVTPDEQFCCSRDIAAYGKTVVIPAGGSVVWLEDMGDHAEVRAEHKPRNTTLGLSIGENGFVYRQWTLLDNGGRVDILRLADGKVSSDYVHRNENRYAWRVT